MVKKSAENGHLIGDFKVYPALRDHPLKTAAQWLRGRRIDDRLGSLWRIHDQLYDLSDFIVKHPGGPEWLYLSRGTDITEAFETSHLNPSVWILLDKYRVRPAESERISPFTFHPDGFYSILKQRVHAQLSSLPLKIKKASKRRVMQVQNGLLLAFITLFLLTGWTGSTWMSVLAGLFLSLNMICAHNFFHQKNSWRMNLFDLGLLSSTEWRVTHALSHHLYTNSILDFELSDFEPWFDFRVYPKGLFRRYLPYIFALIIGPFYFFSEALKRLVTVALGQQKLGWENLLPLLELFLLSLLTDRALLLWLVMQGTASYIFGWIGLTAGHHHPDLYHAGDTGHSFGMDWGLAQLDAVRDRHDVNGLLLAELTMFGNHILHHLFPALDHGLLDSIRPVYEQTAKDFGLPDEVARSPAPDRNQFYYIIGMFQQLSRLHPRPLFGFEGVDLGIVLHLDLNHS